MDRRRWLRALVVVIVLGAVGGAFMVGRGTARVHDRGFANGEAAGYDEGLSVGRALQVGDTLSASTRDVGVAAFKTGYLAGRNDSFGSYDGGWLIGKPYVVVLQPGVDGATYRIAERDELVPGTTYRVCATGVAGTPGAGVAQLCHS
jgi:hypothetical protein